MQGHSFILIFMVAAAGAQECDPPGVLSQEKLRAFSKLLNAHSSPSFITSLPRGQARGAVSPVVEARCGKGTPILFYVANNGVIRHADSMMCRDGQWMVDREVLKAPEVCCAGRIGGSTCASLRKINQSDVEAKHPGWVSSSAKVTNGRVICSGATPLIGYIAYDKDLHIADLMQCTGGKWYSYGGLRDDLLNTTKVCCMGMQIEEKKKPQPKECDLPVLMSSYMSLEKLKAKLPGKDLRSPIVHKKGAHCPDGYKNLVYLTKDGQIVVTRKMGCNKKGNWNIVDSNGKKHVAKAPKVYCMA